MKSDFFFKNSDFFQISKILLLFAVLFLVKLNFLSQNNDLISKVYALHDEVSDPNKQVGNLNPDSVPSLPIGLMKEINGTKYIIAIDSAEFTPEGAYFNAYMALEFPGADRRIAFAAKHIKFNPKGVVGGELAKLQLVSEHYISLGPNTELHLSPDGTNYIEWDCNGFKSVNLHGDFRFSDGILIPDSSTTDTIVKADFQVHVNDIHNILAEVNFSPFQVRGLKGFAFTISEAYVDMSDYVNPQGMIVPSDYPDGSSTLWRGFYLKEFNVKVPSEIAKKGEATEIYAHDMLIDDAGVSGSFGATNIIDVTEGNMSGWGFSVDELNIELTTNQLTGGGMKGEIEVPPLDNNPMKYEAFVSANSQTDEVDFNFTVKPESAISMNCFASTLELYNSSSMSIQKQNGEFKPTLKLNGKLLLERTVFKLSGVDFQNLTIVTEAPFITDGVFGLISDATTNTASNLSNFPISVSNISLGINQGQVVLGTDLAINLSGSNQSGDGSSFSAETHVNVYSIAEEKQADFLGSSLGSGSKMVWSFDKLIVSDINLDIQTQPFKLAGVISFKKNDPVYGNGFYGALNLEIPSVMEGSMYLGCAFGKINGYKYWFVDAAIPVDITCGQVRLTSLIGGMSNHMTGQKSQSDILSQLSSGAALNGGSQTYIPDKNSSISFRAGVGIQHFLKEEAFNGDVLFEINFNANGGLSNISLIGDAYMLVKRAERENATQYVHGTVSILYDNVTEVLDAQLTANAQFSNAITGSLWSQVYISPDEWHVFMGTPSNQATINIANFSSANAYLMVGQNLPPMPPPPPQVLQIFNNASLGSQRDDVAIVSGDGIATGVNFNISFNKVVPFGQGNKYTIYGMGSAGAGFDMTLYNYGPSAHCSGSSERIGLNSWYLNGQLYAYFMLNIGITGRLTGNDFDVSLLNGNAALILQGKLPKPTYVNGAVALNATVLSVINVNLDFDFEFGNNCTIVQ